MLVKYEAKNASNRNAWIYQKLKLHPVSLENLLLDGFNAGLAQRGFWESSAGVVLIII